MKAHLDNLTDLHKGKVRAIVRWTLRELDIDRPDLLVRVRPAAGHKHHGRFYAHARTHWVRVWKGNGAAKEIRPKVPDGVSHLIMARVPSDPWGRTDRQMRGGPPEIRPVNWMESLVCIIAHEGHHFREFLFPKAGKGHIRMTKRGKVHVGPKRHSEVDAEWAEYRLLRRWRER